MTRTHRGTPRTRLRSVLVLALALGTVAGAGAGAETLVIDADRVLPGDGPALENGRVVIEDGRIAAVGRAAEVPAPAGARTLRAAVVTPGLIDVQTSAGLSGLRNIPAVNDQDEETDPDQAALRAIDAFDPRDPLLRYLLEYGTTVIQTGPGPTTPIAGQAGIFRTHGKSADAMVIRSPSALVFNLGETPKAAFGEEGPSTRMGTAALIRGRLLAGRAHADSAGGLFGREPQAPDPGLDALGAVARGELPAVFHARRADDIETALRIARELGLDAVVAGGTEAYLVRDALARSAVPVYVGPVMERVASPESENATYENAALLAEAGVSFALRTGYEAYVPKNRVLLFEAAIAAANGLGPERALRAITVDAAALLGLDDHGTLAVGKVGDVVLFDGDPFEYTSHVICVVVAGDVVFTGQR